jgi:AraC-like DNA-binding protein
MLLLKFEGKLRNEPNRGLSRNTVTHPTMRFVTISACVLHLNISDRREQNLDWYIPGEDVRGEVVNDAGQSFNERTQYMSDFFHLDDRTSDHPFIEKVWRCHTDRGDTFLSIAANSFEMVLTRLSGKSFLTLRGPETVATPLDCPAEGRWVGIRFKPGIFMPRFLPGSLRDHSDVTLPPATGQSFWLNGSALEYPGFDNAESLVKRLTKLGVLCRDPIVEDTLLRRPRELSHRSAQRHFLRSTGVTYTTFRQVERARYATILLREGVPILDVVSRLGYFDQAHLTRSLRRFIGEAPAKIMRRQRQLSLLYKTEFPLHSR